MSTSSREAQDWELDSAEVLRRIATGGRCLLWIGDVFEAGTERLDWRVQMLDEEAAQRLLPVERAPGMSYSLAWYLSRLPEDRARMDRFADASVRRGESYQQEFRCRRADGEIRWFLEDVQITPAGPGHWRAVGVTTDITDRKRAEASQRSAEQDLRSVLALANCLIWHAEIEDRGNEYLDWRARVVDEASAQTFFPVEIPPGMSYLSAWHRCRLPEFREATRARTDRLIRANRGYQNEFCCRSRDGDLRWIREEVRVEPVARGRWRAVGVCTDVTERRLAAERKERLLAGLQTVLSMADELLACSTLEEVLRRAVELPRERLGVDRSAIFLHDGDAAQGTFGTDAEGRTTDERGLRFPLDHSWRHYFRERFVTDPRWEVEYGRPRTLEGSAVGMMGADWVAHTPLMQLGRRPIGVMFNDTAISGAAPDPDQQELLAVYCSLLGHLVAFRQASEALDLIGRHGNCLLWSATVTLEGEVPARFRWNVSDGDLETSQRILPLDLKPGESYHEAARHAMLAEDRERLDAVWRDALLTGKRSFSHEFRCFDRTGQLRSFVMQVSVRPIAPRVWRLAGITSNITDLRQTTEALRKTERQMAMAMDAAQMYLWEVDLVTGALFVSRHAAAIYGIESDRLPDTYAQFLSLVHPDDRGKVTEATAEAVGHSGEFEVEFRICRPTGEVCWLLAKGRAERNEQGDPVRLSGISLDVTHRRELEEQLRQSQKMDAVGRLAGGVAHDFNNMLAVINGYSELLLMRPDLDPDTREKAREIYRAGDRAARLTRQLLTFSRKEITAPRVLDLRETVNAADPMLRRVIGENIELRLHVEPGLGRINADPGHIEQVLLNLALNARDALPQGGHLTIRLENRTFSCAHAGHHRMLPAGEYVMLSVSDDGCGIEEEDLPHLFEPFFTTKGVGKGTGLGLATVYGIVEQCGGGVEVESRPGAGTMFRIFFPRVDAAPHSPKPETAPMAGGTETVLLVEDEPMVRGLVSTVLHNAGYRVLVASHAEEALQLWERNGAKISLLVTDMVMPGRSGRELADYLCARLPDLKVLYMSGYTDDAVALHDVAGTNRPFIAKPFTAAALAQKVREVITGEANR